MNANATSLRWRARIAKESITPSEIRYNPDEEANKGQAQDHHSSSSGLCGTVRLVDGVAAAAVGSALVSLQLTPPSWLMALQSACTIISGPYLAHQHRELLKLGTLRSAQNSLRNQINSLQIQNERLHRHLLRLDGSVQELEDVERELNRIVGDKSNTQRMVNVIKKQERIHQEMKKNLQSKVLQSILGVVVKSDSNRDFAINPAELELLIVRLKMMDGVVLDETKFRQRMANPKHSTLEGIMELVRSLYKEEADGCSAVFELHPELLTR